MRIYRSVCTYIWQDQRFPYVSDDCQLVWFHIFTNPLSTQFGLVRASVEGLAAEKNLNGTWPFDRYQKAFTEGLQEGFFEYDAKALLIYFPKYFSAQHPHNHPNNPNVILGWGEWFDNVPESPLKVKCLENLNEMILSKGKAFQEAFMKGFSKAFSKAALKPLGTEWVNREPKPKPKPKREEDICVRWREQADTFWKVYPRKSGKGNVEKWFKTHQPTDELLAQMLHKIEELKTTPDWKKENGQFIPMPYTWLNGKRWDDEVQIVLQHKPGKLQVAL